MIEFFSNLGFLPSLTLGAIIVLGVLLALVIVTKVVSTVYFDAKAKYLTRMMKGDYNDG